MNPIEPRPLHRGWPLHEPRRQFELGCTFACGDGDLVEFAVGQAFGQHRAGWWECELADNSLTWTAGVYQIFGLPQGARVTRGEALALYFEESRAALERLRSYAIAHGEGFVLDARVRPVSGGGDERWMRLIGAPSLEGGSAVRLHGVKLRL